MPLFILQDKILKTIGRICGFVGICSTASSSTSTSGPRTSWPPTTTTTPTLIFVVRVPLLASLLRTFCLLRALVGHLKGGFPTCQGSNPPKAQLVVYHQNLMTLRTDQKSTTSYLHFGCCSAVCCSAVGVLLLLLLHIW
jgi:hypothetical protein